MTKNMTSNQERDGTASSRPRAEAEPHDSGSLADSSLAGSPAMPAESGRQDEGHRRVPGNDQREGLDAAEAAGQRPAKP
jgi:hypothetical protein